MRISSLTLSCLAALTLAAPAAIHSQTNHERPDPANSGTARETSIEQPRRSVVGPGTIAARPEKAAQPPRIDGADSDPVWQTARRIDAFRQFDPVENGEPSFRTELRVAFDPHNLYVLVRSFDPHPDSIMTGLSRKDEVGLSDNVVIAFDSYNDQRTGYMFQLNASGSMGDGYLFNEGEEDWGWNAVWEGAARIDSLGWVAEYRIPLSQLRYVPKEDNTMGVGVVRTIARTGERVSYPALKRTGPGLSRQLASMSGFKGLASPRRMELLPYSMSSYGARPAADGSLHNASRAQAGIDLKLGLTSNITLDGAVNPDFGQVEADPGNLNLTAFEQFYAEKRPLFLEGSGIFRYDLDCNDGQCTGLFYSRRIGRSPQLQNRWGDAASPMETRILGAAKITGRLSNGLSIGVLNAIAAREQGAMNRTIEPQTGYSVVRLQQDLAGGNSGIGFMLTNTSRETDEWTRDWLRKSAITGGIDGRHRFAGNNWAVNARFAASRVAGTAKAIAATQRSNVHLFQRPDADNLKFDSTLTSLTGWVAQVNLEKQNGGLVRSSTGISWVSPNFEINDIGFRTRADEVGAATWIGIIPTKPFGMFRSGQLNLNGWASANTSGMLISSGANVNANGQFVNYWKVSGGIALNDFGSVYDDRDARGGPAVYSPTRAQTWFSFSGDQRWRVSPRFGFNGSRRLDGLGSSWNAQTGVRLRFGTQFTGSIDASYGLNIDDQQWKGNFSDNGVMHYTFARLYQKSGSVTARFNYTITPTLSFQSYIQPFVSTGYFTEWRSLADGRSHDRDTRFNPYSVRGNPGSFRFGQLRTNNVVRWEYRPGSTLFFVWTQARDASDEPDEFSVTRGYSHVFGQQPQNVFLIKASYWLGR